MSTPIVPTQVPKAGSQADLEHLWQAIKALEALLEELQDALDSLTDRVEALEP